MLTAPAPGFDDPLALLAACHGRILARCETLGRLVAELKGKGPNPEALAAAANVVAYFSTAGRHHHQDEEQDLFPLLRGDPELAGVLDDLAKDHLALDALWLQLEPWLANPERIRDLDQFARFVEEFCSRQFRHVEIENRVVLSRARELLPPEILSVIGSRMAARRGLSL